jgi:hypothetical protein
MVVGPSILKWTESDVLLRQRGTIGDQNYDFQIKNVKGELQAQWQPVASFWTAGKPSASHLGFADQVGTKDPKINVDPETGRVTFEVGTAKVIVRIVRGGQVP